MSGTGSIVVIGAGIAGVSAAHAASTSGADVILLDEQNAPGGWLRSSIHEFEHVAVPFSGSRGYELAHSALEFLTASSIDYRPGSIAWGLFEDCSLGVVGPDGAYQLQPERIVIASGSTEIVWPFGGWTLPGIMTARAARAFMHLHFVLPGLRVAVVGSGEDADQFADDLIQAGSSVACRIDTPDGLQAGGGNAVEWIQLDGQRTAVDAVVLAWGAMPDPELARHAMAEPVYSEADGCHVTVRDRTMSTSVDGIYVVGDAGGMTTVAEAAAQGFVAGYAATGSDRLDDAIAELERVSASRADHLTVGDAERIPDDVQIDREEQVTAGRIRQAIASGAVSINDVKRRTRAGMGVSQGRDTEYVVARMIHQQTGIPLDQLAPMTARPPARLVSLADLASLAVSTA